MILKIFRGLSALSSAGLGILSIFRFTQLDDDTSTFQIYVLIFGVILLCQFFYTLRAGRLLGGQKFHHLETLDNNWAYEDNENQAVIQNNHFDIVLAAIGGIAWTFMLFVMAFSFRYIGAISFKDTESIYFSLIFIFSLTGSLPSIIFNIRTWNMARIK